MHILITLKALDIQKYNSSYKVENYELLAWCCKANLKSASSRKATTSSTPCSHTFKYLNYKRNHTANNNKCLF